MDVMAQRTVELIQAAEGTVGALIHPAELARFKRDYESSLLDARSDYIAKCQHASRLYVGKLMKIASEHDVKDAGKDNLPTFSIDSTRRDDNTTE